MVAAKLASRNPLRKSQVMNPAVRVIPPMFVTRTMSWRWLSDVSVALSEIVFQGLERLPKGLAELRRCLLKSLSDESLSGFFIRLMNQRGNLLFEVAPQFAHEQSGRRLVCSSPLEHVSPERPAAMVRYRREYCLVQQEQRKSADSAGD